MCDFLNWWRYVFQPMVKEEQEDLKICDNVQCTWEPTVPVSRSLAVRQRKWRQVEVMRRGPGKAWGRALAWRRWRNPDALEISLTWMLAGMECQKSRSQALMSLRSRHIYPPKCSLDKCHSANINFHSSGPKKKFLTK